jgi:hypothetical protein
LKKLENIRAPSETSLIGDGENSKVRDPKDTARSSNKYKFISKDSSVNQKTLALIMDYEGSQTFNKDELSTNSKLEKFRRANKILSTKRKFLKILNRGHSNIFDKQEVEKIKIFTIQLKL